MEQIRITLYVQKDRCSDFDKYLNDMVWGLRQGAQVDDIVWTNKCELLIVLSVTDKDEKWGALSELLTWVYCDQYNGAMDVKEIHCD